MQPESAKILFIDDDARVRKAFARGLTSAGFRVDLAADATEAFSFARQESYPIIATDLRMPGLDGLSLIEALKPLQPYSSYLLVTAASQEELPEEARSLHRVVSKPWDLTSLKKTLSEALNVHDLRQAAAEAQTQTLIIDPRILIVEPKLNDAEEISEALIWPDRGATQTEYAHSLETALELLHEGEYQIILTDLLLPDSQGLDVIIRLHRASPETPIIALAQSEDDHLSLQSLQLGAQDYLIKSELEPKMLTRAMRYSIERKRSERRMAFLAQHDQLTGLANRNLCRDRIIQAIARNRRSDQHVAVMSLDLNRFKSINDCLGHESGDSLLREVALRFRACVREYDTVARLGGDEFAIVLESVESELDALQAAERVLKTLDTPIKLDGHELIISTSIGIAMYPDVAGTVDELLKAADSALQLARDRGHAYEVARAQSKTDMLPRLRLEHDLRHALERREFVLHYQPLLNLKTQEPTSMEALLRWRRKDKLVPPNDFISILEETRMIIKVGAWVLEESCRKLRELQDAGLSYSRVSVNVSPVQFEDDHLLEHIEHALDSADLRAENLELEITEGLLMRDTERTRGLLDAFKDMGVRVAIDDFGTGYSSLSYLKRFSVDTLKIDRSFIRNLEPGNNQIDSSIAGAVIGLGHKLGFEIVAEGVEKAEQLEFLRKEGCDIVQGYYISRPVEAPEKVSFDILKKDGDS